jgi:hypothetical protein
LKAPARLVLLLGAAALGLLLLQAAPREVTLVYPLPGPAEVAALEVDLRRGAETVRHAEFRFPGGAPEALRHAVRLPDGDYTVALRLARRDGPPRRLASSFTVEEGGPIVLSLSEAP